MFALLRGVHAGRQMGSRKSDPSAGKESRQLDVAYDARFVFNSDSDCDAL